MLTSTVVPSTIAGGLYTNIKIRVEMNRISLRFVTNQGPHRASLRQNHSCSSFDTNLSRVACVLPRHAKFEDFLFHLINPRRLPRAAPSGGDFQTAVWAHLPHAAPQAPPYRTDRSLRSAYSPALTASNDPTLPE